VFVNCRHNATALVFGPETCGRIVCTGQSESMLIGFDLYCEGFLLNPTYCGHRLCLATYVGRNFYNLLGQFLDFSLAAIEFSQWKDSAQIPRFPVTHSASKLQAGI
jgi:hypothetical protein